MSHLARWIRIGIDHRMRRRGTIVYWNTMGKSYLSVDG